MERKRICNKGTAVYRSKLLLSQFHRLFHLRREMAMMHGDTQAPVGVEFLRRAGNSLNVCTHNYTEMTGRT